jgi:hypothetical protein
VIEPGRLVSLLEDVRTIAVARIFRDVERADCGGYGHRLVAGYV